MRRRLIIILLLLSSTTSAQSLLDIRGIGMGSDISTSYDLPALFSNPAGLSTVHNWQFNNTAGLITGSSSSAFFGSVGIAHRFYNSHVAAFGYAPSRSLNLHFIANKSHEENDPQNQSVLYELISDKRIRYNEMMRIGYGYSPSRKFSFGATSQFQQEEIDELATTIITKPNVPSSSNVVREYFTASAWNFNLGFQYRMFPSIQIGAVAYNLLTIRESELPDKYRKYSFLPEKVIRFGASARPLEDLLLSADFDTKIRSNIGCEMNAYSPTSPFVIRFGSWIDFKSEHPFYAFSFGTGYSYKFLTFDASYLTFFDKQYRNSSITENVFTPLSNIELNQYTSDRFSVSISVVLGSLRDAVARIEHVEITNPVFPASYRIHATRPLGYARIRNLTNEPIQVRLLFYVRRLMDQPTQTSEFYLGSDEVKDIPFTAEFNESIMSIRNESLRESELGVVASQIDNYEDVLQAKLLIYGRNSWNGDPLMLKYFITPNDPGVVKFSRKAISENRDYIESTPVHLHRLEQARTVCNKLANILTYVADPRVYDQGGELETVQYPSETLDLRSGDCDDLTVCYSSLLNSLGFETAFVDVRKDSTDAEGNSAHIYLLFDTGIAAEMWQQITNNEKKIVLRKNSTGAETIWIPIETTIIKDGFDAAWEKGALEYFHDVELNLGLLRGNIKIVDIYHPE